MKYRLGLAEDSRFKNDIVVAVAALVQRTARNDDLTMAAQKLQEFFYLIERKRIPATEARTRQDVRELLKQRQGYDYLIAAVQPGAYQACGGAGGVDERRNPDVGIKQGDDRHGVRPSLQKRRR